MNYVICKNCCGRVELPDHAREASCPYCGTIVTVEPRQVPNADQQEQERIRRIAEAAAAEERLRIARERQLREVQDRNQKLREAYLMLVGALNVLAVLSVAFSSELDGTIAMLLGAVVGALLVQVAVFGASFGLSLWAFSARMKNKSSKKAALVLTRIFACVGIVLWGMISAGALLGGDDLDMMIVWALCNVALQLIAFIMPGKVTTGEEK